MTLTTFQKLLPILNLKWWGWHVWKHFFFQRKWTTLRHCRNKHILRFRKPKKQKGEKKHPMKPTHHFYSPISTKPVPKLSTLFLKFEFFYFILLLHRVLLCVKFEKSSPCLHGFSPCTCWECLRAPSDPKNLCY